MVDGWLMVGVGDEEVLAAWERGMRQSVDFDLLAARCAD